MIALAYIGLLAVLLWAARRDEKLYSLARSTPVTQLQVRIAASVGALLFAALGVLLAQADGHGSVVRNVAATALIVGASVYLSGVAAWHGRPGVILRRVGWLAIVAVCVVPSSITPAILLALPALPTLIEIPRRTPPNTGHDLRGRAADSRIH